MTQYSEPFLLSTKGSTRATAYLFSNKSITLDGKTHVVWLDAVAGVRGRTYDHASGTWGETLELFEGCDNHTTPALTADAEGHLHLVYGPHGWWGNWNQARFNHVVSAKPGSLEEWGDEGSFGYDATYASMVSTPAGLDCVVYRGGEPPSSVMFQKQRRLGGWTSARELMKQEIEPQYTHVGANVVCSADGTLYVGAHFYNDNTDGTSLGVAVLKSVDLGETWLDMAGQPTAVPICYDARFAIPHPEGVDARLAGLALDSKGTLWAATTAPGHGLLSHWCGDAWQTTDLAAFLPEERVPAAGPISIDTQDRVHMAVSLLRTDCMGEAWGHPSLEVFHLVSSDGGEGFECNLVSRPDPEMANWLPNISLSGLFHPVEKPVILYTHGVPGEGCSPPTETEVYCVMVEG